MPDRNYLLTPTGALIDVGETRAVSAPRALWARLRRLQKMPYPVLSEKAKDEWRREMPSIIDDLFYEVRMALGDKEARSLFEDVLKLPPYYRIETRLFKAMALDLYDCIEAIGEVPKHNIAARVAVIMKQRSRFVHKGEASIARLVRGFVRERERKNG